MSQKEYDPAIYGPAKAEFLNHLSDYSTPTDYSLDDTPEGFNEEKAREDFIREIREGKFVIPKR
jgi:hypothetical protein